MKHTGKGVPGVQAGRPAQEGRLQKGLTQEQLAEKCGTNKAYISKVEKDIKHVCLSTLQKIIEVGPGGHLQLSIKL